MTAVYNKLGIHFLYPENWKLLDESDGIPHVITLESPDGAATWAAHLYPENEDCDPSQILKDTIEALQDTYEEAEISSLDCTDMIEQFETIPNLKLGLIPGYDTAIHGVEAMFYCLDFLIRARLCLFSTSGQYFLVWTQAEDREFDTHETLFSAMTISLLQTAPE